MDVLKRQDNEGQYFLQECPRGTKSTEQARSTKKPVKNSTRPMDQYVSGSSTSLANRSLEASQEENALDNQFSCNSLITQESMQAIRATNSLLETIPLVRGGEGQGKPQIPAKACSCNRDGYQSTADILDGEMREIGHVGRPDPHEEANFEEHHHNVYQAQKSCM